MNQCTHESCGREKRVWLPRGSHSSDVVPHPWCKHCGVIKNISDDHPQKLGYWMNILSKIEYHLSLKKIQKRLVAKCLESHPCFNDLYGTTGSDQHELFVKTVSKICNLSYHSVDSLVR